MVNVNLKAIFIYCYVGFHALLETFEYTKDATLQVVKMGGDMGQGPATEVT